MTLNETSKELQISPATLRNWVRSGLILKKNSGGDVHFTKRDVEKLKDKLKSGEILKLRKRANKNISSHRHDHAELLHNNSAAKSLLKWLVQERASLKSKLFVIYLEQLKYKKLCVSSSVSFRFKSKKIENEIALWKIDSESEKIKKLCASLRALKINLNDNLLSYAYQSVSQVGAKHRAGAYYTPISIANKLAQRTIVEPGAVLDPCCGAGQFLVAAYRQLESLQVNQPWKSIYGADSDLLAVLVSRANLTLISAGRADSVRQIRQQDSLLADAWHRNFKYVLTNPPWGAQLSSSALHKLRSKYPEVKSTESFAYFLVAGINFLARGGQLGYVLPDSFLNIRTHTALRKYLLTHFKIKSICRCEERFSGVFTKAVTLLIENSKSDPLAAIEINNGRSVSRKSIADICSQEDCVISIAADTETEELLKKIESRAQMSLKDNSDWALGIVTGDNQKFLINRPASGFQPLYSGADVFRFKLKAPSRYVQLQSTKLQQVAPVQYYRCKEKLVYRFICKELVFAVDRSQSATLNSANIMIPKLPGYSIRSVCGILNSAVAQFYYQKKFNTFKTLKGNLEKFPFPQAEPNLLLKIEAIVRKLEMSGSKKDFCRLNELVATLYGLSQKDRSIIKSLRLSEAYGVIW